MGTTCSCSTYSSTAQDAHPHSASLPLVIAARMDHSTNSSWLRHEDSLNVATAAAHVPSELISKDLLIPASLANSLRRQQVHYAHAVPVYYHPLCAEDAAPLSIRSDDVDSCYSAVLPCSQGGTLGLLVSSRNESSRLRQTPSAFSSDLAGSGASQRTGAASSMIVRHPSSASAGDTSFYVSRAQQQQLVAEVTLLGHSMSTSQRRVSSTYLPVALFYPIAMMSGAHQDSMSLTSS